LLDVARAATATALVRRPARRPGRRLLVRRPRSPDPAM